MHVPPESGVVFFPGSVYQKHCNLTLTMTWRFEHACSILKVDELDKQLEVALEREV